MPRSETNIDDFRAGSPCRIIVEVALHDDAAGETPHFLAEASFENEDLIATASADSPAAAFTGAAAAAGELLAREHSAARMYHEDLQERLRIGYYQDEAEAE